MTIGYSIFYKPWSSRTIGSLMKGIQGEWFNGKTAAFKVADLGSNPCSPKGYSTGNYIIEHQW